MVESFTVVKEHWARKRAWMIPLFDVYKQADDAIGIARKEGRDEFVVLQMKTANRMYREAEEGQ